MKFNIEKSAVFNGAYTSINFVGRLLPFEYSGPRSEYMAGRESAWLGINLNFADPYDVYDYDDPEDFYYDNYDDFECYEDAEDYFDDHNY